MNDLLRIVAVLLLVLGNAIFVAAEYALVTARRSRLEERAEAGGRGARTALRLMDEPVRFISTVQVGITVFGIALGAIGEPLVSRYFDFLPRGVAFAISFVVLTYLSVTLGELVPKAVALQQAERLAVVLAAPLEVLSRLAYPLVWLLDRSANVVLRLMRVKPAPAGMIAFTREDIRHSVAAAEDSGEIQTAEEEMLYKVFDFAEKEAHDVMVPRPIVVGLSVSMPPEEALRAVLDSPFTRYPVFRESLDDIVGILHIRALVAALEDLLEEIVGDIEDEFDLPDESVERLDERTVRISGTFPIDDFNERFGTDLEQEDYHTVAGYVFGLLGRAADPGDAVESEGVRFEVLETEGSRIQRLQIEFLPAPVGADDAPEAA